MKCIGVLAGLAVLFAGTAFSQDDAAKKELGRLQGKWKIVDVKAADAIEIDLGEYTTMQIQGDKVILTLDVPGSKEGKKEVPARIKVDPTKRPKTMDSTPLDPKAKGKTNLAIYALDGDTLRILRNYDGSRPKELTYKKGENALTTFKRVSK